MHCQTLTTNISTNVSQWVIGNQTEKNQQVLLFFTVSNERTLHLSILSAFILSAFPWTNCGMPAIPCEAPKG